MVATRLLMGSSALALLCITASMGCSSAADGETWTNQKPIVFSAESPSAESASAVDASGKKVRAKTDHKKNLPLDRADPLDAPAAADATEPPSDDGNAVPEAPQELPAPIRHVEGAHTVVHKQVSAELEPE